MTTVPPGPEQPTATTLVAPAQPDSRLRANALNLGGSVAIALGSAGPTASIALVLAGLIAASSYASPLAILILTIPMIGIAIAYRRLNQWNVNCGATYIWAGRAISPYFGFMIGWLIFLAYFLGVMSIVLPIGPYALQLGPNSFQNSQVAEAVIGSVAIVFVTVIAYLGIRITARVQWVLIAIEYVAITLLAIVALIAVFGGNSHSVPFSWSWFSWGTMGGTSGFVAAALIAVYMFSGWDTAILVNEETENATQNPGTAVIISVLVLGFMFAFFTFAFQGAVHGKALQANGSNALSYIAQVLGGSALAKYMILAVLLSAVGSALASLVSAARITFAMGYDRVLPPVLARTSPRYLTPSVATVIMGVLAIAVTWLYSLGSSSVQDSFNTVVASVGLLFALFYAATGFAVAVYYRKLAVRGVLPFIELVVLPVGSALFLLYVSWKSVTTSLGGWTSQNMVYLYVMLAIGVAVMLYVRLRGTSQYFDMPIEAYDPSEITEPSPA